MRATALLLHPVHGEPPQSTGARLIPAEITDRFESALKLAHEFHRDDHRKGTEIPYLSHLLQVAGLVLEGGGDEDQAIAALFHDAIEDAGSDDAADEREARIRDGFGDRVAELVLDCTDGRPEQKEETPWKERKEGYIHHLWTEVDDAAVLISAADKLHNARAILRDYRTHGEAVWTRFDGGRSGTLWYYRALVGAYQYRGVDGYVDELNDIVTMLEEETAVA